MSEICLQIQLVLKLFHPLGEFVAEVVEGVFEVGDSLHKSIERFLADTSDSGRLRNPQIGKGFLEFEELLFKC